MLTIADGVEFDTIAREWRCKWSDVNDKAALIAAQQALSGVLEELKVLGKVQRVVCGGSLDFKVITSMPACQFNTWREANFAPEEAFLKSLQAIEGITVVETQSYTLMEM
jgi:predicted TPR repeat methyltransferase